MNTCVKQKKLDEEGGRVSEERGLESAMQWLGWGLGRGMGSSVRCLSGLPGLVDGLFHVCLCVCACPRLCVSTYPPVSLTYGQILRGKGWHSSWRETHSKH